MENDKQKFKNEFRKRLITFTVDVLKFCSTLREDRNLWPVADQLARSAASVGANVSEAKGSGSLRGYKNYFEIALKSSNETNYWLTVVSEYQIDDNAELERLLEENYEITRVINASVLTMKGSQKSHHS